MPKRVLSVGQCGPDHVAICGLLRRHFDVRVERADALPDALAAVRQAPHDLVLVNRKLDVDYSDGMEVIRAIKAEPSLAGVPVMLVTNFPDHQRIAVEAGAERGFGKLELDEPQTVARLARFLG